MSASVALNFRHQPGWVRAIPFALYMALMAAQPALEHVFSDIRWAYALRVGVTGLSLVLLWPYFTELRQTAKLHVKHVALSIVVGLVVFALWINLDVPGLSISSGDAKAGFDARDAAGSIQWDLAIVRLLGASVVVPVMEELFWRSFILRWVQRPDFMALHPHLIGLRAMLISSCLFGVEHHLWFAGIVAGMAYAWLYKQTSNLWSPILSHGVTNFVLGVWVLQTGSWQFW